jgi:hypothetical protein
MTDQETGSTPAIEQFEVVGLPTRPSGGSSRKFVAGLAVAAVSAAAVTGGVWAWRAWSEQGAQPAEALPASTLAYVALDFDPSGQQKIEAFNTLRKFPSLKRELGLDHADDLTKSVVEQMASDRGCELDYARDIKPWMGSRTAFAVVDGKRPKPVFVAQAKDVAQAKQGLQAVVDGCENSDFGFVVEGGWALLAADADIATQVKQSASRGTLADDKDFQKLTEAAGSPGLATIYAAPEAGPALLEEIEREPFVGWTATTALNAADPVTFFLSSFAFYTVAQPSFSDSSSSSFEEPDVSPELRAAQRKLEKRFEHFEELSPKQQKRLMREQTKLMEQMYGGSFEDVDGSYGDLEDMDGESGADEFAGPTLPPALRSSLAHFTGLGGVARFDDGALEIEIDSDILEGTSSDLYAGSAGGDMVSDLPESTAIAYGAGLSEKWVDALIARFSQPFMLGQETDADPAAAFEKATGLDLPGDLEDLGGDGIALVAGTGFTADEVSEDPSRAKVAARITGDADRVESALEKLRARLGPEKAKFLQSRPVAEGLVVGPDIAYLKDLADSDHGLGDSDRFRKVVPKANDATTALYLDFDAGDWLAKLAAGDGDREDAEPLDSFGMTMKKDGDRQKLLARVTFD